MMILMKYNIILLEQLLENNFVTTFNYIEENDEVEVQTY